ncbi:MAG: hypothetical protein EP305_02135 [Bacteroidetes bacterium]|nr:MAG: hypothetical protein EP305_02135 [Bacteroidota bacterium]
MKALFTSLVVLLMVASCKSAEVVTTENKDVNEEVTQDGAVTGVVYVNLKGCPVLILVDSGTDQKRLYPVNLPEEFKVDGTKISFNYVPSRAMQPEGCTLIDMVVSVENVQKTR